MSKRVNLIREVCNLIKEELKISNYRECFKSRIEKLVNKVEKEYGTASKKNK